MAHGLDFLIRQIGGIALYDDVPDQSNIDFFVKAKSLLMVMV